ncbi:MarR family winged helix-turn-helix transcriptional regulator [Cupriavidus sp. 2TAF22]|uniref:MarR family winged helix-turn-helix transcriptional regulator n=1 Tax=unclassified Cupriavidus TaxID=2640874 RepID=UPI003F8DC50A
MESGSTQTGAPQSGLDVTNRLFFRLFQIGNVLQRQTAKELGISGVQWAVMGALSRPKAKDGMSFSELAEYLVVSRQNLDGVLKRLERDEHVSRVASEEDRRARRVVLTDKGRHFWEALQPRIHEFYRQAVVNLRFDDKVSFLHFVNTLQADLGKVRLP